jgi:hypothetical protein
MVCTLVGQLGEPEGAVTDDHGGGQHTVRVISIYATPWRYRGSPRQGPEEKLPLGPRLEEFHYLFQEQLPRPLYDEPLAADQLGLLAPAGASAGSGRSGTADLQIAKAQMWLFYLPSDQVVAALDLEFSSAPLDVDAALTTRVLEHCAFDDFTVDQVRLGEHVAELAEAEGCQAIKEDVQALPGEFRQKLPPERHQIVFAPRTEGGQPLTEAQVEPILYRSEPPFRPEFIDLKRPAGLNPSGADKVGLVTPYTSLLVGHNQYIQNSVFLTAVQAVGTSARFRQIWHRTHAMVSQFRARFQAEEVGVQSRAGMEELADELGNLELELSFSVETSSDLGLLIPALRSVSFHRELYAAMELQERAERVSRMFTRLDSSINSELTAIGIREAKQDGRRRLRWAFAINLLSILVVPITVLLAFFGVSTKDVTDGFSILDFRHFRLEYILAGALALIPLAAWLGAALVTGWQNSRDEQARLLRSPGVAVAPPPPAPGPPARPAGGALAGAAGAGQPAGRGPAGRAPG